MHVKIFVKIVKILLIDSLFLFIIFSRDIKKEEKRIMMKKWGFILLAFILSIRIPAQKPLINRKGARLLHQHPILHLKML